MAAYRQGRINEEMTRVLAEIVRNVKDWRLKDCVISITSVSCAHDLSSAKVYYSYIGKSSSTDISQGLKSASGYIRGQLAQKLDLRQTPRLVFEYDNSIENGAHIEKLLTNISYSDDTVKNPENDSNE